MSEYHKIQTVFKRDPANRHKTLLMGEWSIPAFGYLADNEWVFTEKVDGTNIRVYWDGNGSVKLAGRTDNAQMLVALHDRLRKLFPSESFAKAAMPECVLYGEGYGAKIQSGGGYKADGVDFVLFDVRVGDWWLERENVVDIGGKMGLDVVPVIGHGTLDTMVALTEAGFTSHWGNFPAEGIVARPATELLDRGGQRVITKIKAKDFAR